MANFISEMRNMSSAPIQEINREIEKTPKQLGEGEQKILSLAERLKETEKQLRTLGDTSEANKLKEMIQAINAKTTDVKGSMQELRQHIEKTFGTEALKQFDKELKNIDKSTQKVGKKSNFGQNLKTALGIGTVALGIRKAVGFFNEANTEAIDYVETVNLFNVAMGKKTDQYGKLNEEASKYYTKAIAFQEKLSDKLHIDIEESMNYQALFNSMSKSMGIADEYAYKLSENFTKLGYDLSSLFNINTENAMQKLRAGLSGQTKPLRDLGLDITQQSLEPLLDELGIERSVKQLSQAEKMVARYIVVLRQASLAHGDFAKTMDSPANQLRIFNAQLTAFKRNMGSLWQGLLGNILPYVNAIMMVINELLKMVAKLFGYEVWEQDVSISTDIGADDLADDLGTATQKAKEFKKQLMGFDEINNITLPDKTSGGSGGASVGGIDKRLLDAMKEYDNLMDKVKSKATDIRDKMMEWLGFERIGDSWKLKEGLTNAEKILDVMKTIGLAIGTWKVSKTITDLMHNLGIINETDAFKMAFGITLTATGIFAQYKGTKHLLNGDVDIFTLLETFLGMGAGTFGIVNILKATKFGKTLSLANQIKIGLGVMVALQGIQILTDGIKNSNIANIIGGALETGLGVGLTAMTLTGGNIVASLAIAVGVTAFVSLVDVVYGNSNWGEIAKATDELAKEIETSNSSYEQKKKAIDDSVNSQIAELQYVQVLRQQLGLLADENGNVKKGYEERVDYILGELNQALGTEYKRNGEIIENYKDMSKEISKIIEEKKRKIHLEAVEEKYKEALKKQITDTDNLTKAQKEYNKALEEYQKWQNSDAWKTGAIDGLKHKETVDKAKENLDNMKKAVEEATNDVVMCEEQLTASTINATNQITSDFSNMGQTALEHMKTTAEKSTTQFLIELEKYSPAVQASLMAQVQTLDQTAPEVIAKWKQLAENSTNEFMLGIAKAEPAVQAQVLSSITTVDNLTPDMKKAWANLAQQSAEDFTTAIDKIPVSARGAILNGITTTEELTENTKQAWANLAKQSEQEYNTAISTLDDDTAKAVQDAVNTINNKKPEMNNAGDSLADEGLKGAKDKVNDKNSGASKIGEWFVSGFTGMLTSGGALKSAYNAGASLVAKALLGGKEKQNSNSPAKETMKLGNYFTEGYILGLKEKQAEVKKVSENLVGTALKELNKFDSAGFTINPDDFKIDTSQFIDYGEISGAIATQNNIKVDSDIEGRIENAIYSAFSNVTIPVEIEAITEEGVIVKKVSKGFNEYVMQTGELPFTVPVI